MMKTIWLDYPGTPFSTALAGLFRKHGWEVLTCEAEKAAEKTESLDFAVFGTAFDRSSDSLENGLHYDTMLDFYEKVAAAPFRKLQALLPLLDKGEGKRICFFTDAKATVNQSEDVSGYAGSMAHAALHTHAVIAYNQLKPDGYTLRLMDPRGPLSAEALAGCAYAYFTRDRGFDSHNDTRIDENIPKIMDYKGSVIPW